MAINNIFSKNAYCRLFSLSVDIILFIHIRSLCPMVTYCPISDIINQHKTCKAIFHCII
ncbi:MAG: hypothetical protein YK1312THETA_1780003 [Marine Group I thaumarchaeote]|nr:MAG: hypothetical protein YK1312THETA_1780003 [Marine Group I thaumarchaeote]